MNRIFMSIEQGFHKDNPHCFRCGDCCQRIPPELTKEEIDLIMSRLNQREKQIFKDSLTTDPQIADPIDVVRVPLSKTAWIKAPCCFLDFEKKKGKKRAFCRIYKFRPEMCRIFFCGKESLNEPLLLTKYKFEMSGKFLDSMKRDILMSQGTERLKELETAIKEAAQETT